MKPSARLAIGITLGAVAGGAVYYGYRMAMPNVPKEEKPSSAVTSNTSEPEPKYPVSLNETPNAQPGSTNLIGQTIESALSNIVGRDLFESIFNMDDFARRVVVTVDSATNQAQLPTERSPFRPLDSPFVTVGNGNKTAISEKNYARYKPYVRVANAIDAHEFIKIYVHFYPLLQSAYRELGMNKYFNDRVVEVIDHILKTPEVAGNPRLYRPSPKYKYKLSDLELENLSSSQKVLIRMGYENARVIKVKLREIRRLLVHLGKPNHGNLTLGAVEK